MLLGNYMKLKDYKIDDLVEYCDRPEETYKIKILDLIKDYMEIVNVDKNSENQSVHFHGIDPNHIKLKGQSS